MGGRTSAPPGATALASLPRRIGALAYELLVVSALTLVAGFLTLPLDRSTAAGSDLLRVPDATARAMSFLVVFAVAGLYFAWSWTGGRRTLPMKTWRLTVVRADGRVPDARTALLRYFAAWLGPALALSAYLALRPAGVGTWATAIAGVNFLWAFFDSDRQFLHDRIAATRIVEEPRPR